MFNMYPLECYAPYYVKFGMDQRESCKFLNYRNISQNSIMSDMWILVVHQYTFCRKTYPIKNNLLK